MYKTLNKNRMTNNYSLKSKPIMLEAKTARALAKKIKGTGWVMQQVLLTSKKNLTGGGCSPLCYTGSAPRY